MTNGRGRTGRRAYTLVEMSVVLIIMGIFITLAMPRFSRSVESARADVAGANLRAIWTAERIYWLDNRTYTTSLDVLVNLNLLDPSITSNTSYTYLVTAADVATFTATAQRAPNVSWSGTVTITQDGGLTGTLTCPGQANIVVGFQ
ncbi:MAG TPA: prepilin-type N-terminal cleavage/methylation domain-containing protein [Isosphaeraceae bacterium]|nr:prepilin-type N-terminal cleavage/methylation domain-containing protein [Isosphaeraceae bacterium]